LEGRSPETTRRLVLELVNPENATLFAASWQGYESLTKCGFKLISPVATDLERLDRTCAMR